MIFFFKEMLTISEVKATAEDVVRIVDICSQERKNLDGNHRAVRRLRTRSLSSSIEIFSGFEEMNMDDVMGPAEKRNVVLVRGSTKSHDQSVHQSRRGWRFRYRRRRVFIVNGFGDGW